MSKLDGKQERLQELKTYRNFALTSLLALIGFIFTKTDETNIYILFLTVLVIFVLGIVIFVLQKKDFKIYQRDRGVIMEILTFSAAVFGILCFFAAMFLVIKET